MKTVKYILLAFVFLNLTSVAQTDTTRNQKHCVVCVDFKKDYNKGRILLNEQIGIADTTICFLKGKITDIKNEDIPFASITLTNKESGKTHLCNTDLDGKYRLTLSSGQYIYTVAYFGYPPFKIDSVSFHSGDIREINIDIGENCCLKTKTIICPTTIQSE